MAKLSDLLVSYKQVNLENQDGEYPIFEYQPILRSTPLALEEVSTPTTTQETTPASTPVGIAAMTVTPTAVASRTPSMSRSAWTEAMKAAYKRAGVKNDNAIKMLVAQDALESGWGSSAQGKYNYGNITTGSDWKGAYVNGYDEDSSGNSISAKFRSYNSIDNYVQDKLSLLKRLYDFNESDSIDQFASKLTGNNKGHRKYAVANSYAQSLKDTFNKSFRLGGIIRAGNGTKFVDEEAQKRSWLRDMANAYKAAGVPSDNLIRLLLAQDAMESGWGTTIVGDYNYGNLHAGDSWTGKTKRGWDKDANGKRYETDFRSYNDSTEYARDKWDRAINLYGLDADDTYDEFMDKLLGGNPNKYHYAEDPEYREKVRDMIYSVNKRIDLSKLEEERQAQQQALSQAQTTTNPRQGQFVGISATNSIPGLGQAKAFNPVLFQTMNR